MGERVVVLESGLGHKTLEVKSYFGTDKQELSAFEYAVIMELQDIKEKLDKLENGVKVVEEIEGTGDGADVL